jgi:tRNA threonylcarbamoyl adenosine modification protein YeaZ
MTAPTLQAPVLAIDTALAACAVAARARDGGLTVDEAIIGVGHAEHLIPQIDAVLGQAGLAPADLGRVVAVVGPGSFTGIRAGLAAARGLGLALGIPVVGVTTLEALAAEARDLAPGRAVVAVLDARRDEVYAQAFTADGAPASPPALLTRAAAAKLAAGHDAVLIGSGAALVAEHLPDAKIAGPQPQAAITTILAIGAARAVPDRPPGPLYIRGADAKVPQNAAIARRPTEEARP